MIGSCGAATITSLPRDLSPVIVLAIASGCGAVVSTMSAPPSFWRPAAAVDSRQARNRRRLRSVPISADSRVANERSGRLDGQTLVGRYEIIDLIGVGGMGVETARSGADLAARDEREQQQVAILWSMMLLLGTVGIVRGDDALTVRGEVIIIEGQAPPKVKPKPRNYSAKKAPPYSDRVILSDAWTSAWLLLDVSEDGEVTRFVPKASDDLDQIAASEVFKLRFEPARDVRDRPVRTFVLWSIEWPSAGWLEKVVATRTRMPPLIGAMRR